MAKNSFSDFPEYKETFKDVLETIDSRYANTEVVEDSGEVFRSSYELKSQFRPSNLPGGEQYVRVLAEEVGRLDLVSLRVYRTPKYYWVIAEANEIIDPIQEITKDKVLIIPKISGTLI